MEATWPSTEQTQLTMEQKFALQQLKNEINNCNDIEALKEQLIRLTELNYHQKNTFLAMVKF